ncbi:FidL-like protein [Yersinia aleksiciae]|uniref:FidL-like protein n=1 Tax=Yersinia aleksiciae TaxID=263819 RepID=UPI001643D6A2|nr:FidL-like protein [Yersinia aleksiciae]
MKLKSKHVGFFAGLVAMACVVIALFWFREKPKGSVSYNCLSAFGMKVKSQHFTTSLNIFLEMRKDNTGYLDIAGKVTHNGNENKIARSYSFNYKKQKGDIYHLTDIVMSKRTADTTDDVLMNNLIFSIDSGIGRYIRITQLNNAYIVGNLYSPLFFCTVN